MFNLYVENTWVVFAKGFLTTSEDESDIATKINESILHRWIEHEFVVVFIK